MTTPIRKPPLALVIAAFALFGALEIGLVWLVASDPFTRVVFTVLIGVAQVIGCALSYRALSRPRRVIRPRQP